MERWLVARSPLLLKLFDNVLGREVEIDLGSHYHWNQGVR